MNAQWSLDSGRTVDFRIIEVPGSDKVNPFKQYQRRRNGKVGQSFHASIVEDGAVGPTYSGECMLAGWGDTSDKGQWFRLWLDEESGLHPFAGFARRAAGRLGSMFAAVIVVTDEPGGGLSIANEREQSGSGGNVQKRRALSSEIHLMITGARFIQWLDEKSEYTEALHKKGRSWNAETARSYVKWKLGIESLSDLDRMADKAEQFHEQFRRPFRKWNGQE